VEARRKFLAVVVGIQLGPQIDVALRQPQSPEILSDVVRVGVASDYRRHHEGRIDDLTEAELLKEIVRPSSAQPVDIYMLKFRKPG
jgi:hypothetical protein